MDIIKLLRATLRQVFTQIPQCAKDQRLNFHKLDCITGSCANHCWTQKSDPNDENIVTYTVFERTPTSYYNKGIRYSIIGFTRCDKKESLKNIHLLLEKSAKSYIGILLLLINHSGQSSLPNAGTQSFILILVKT